MTQKAVNLSNREREVLLHLAAGLTQAETAERLSLSPSTVGQYVARAARKMGTRTQTATVATALITRAITPVNRLPSVREAVAIESEKARRRFSG